VDEESGIAVMRCRCEWMNSLTVRLLSWYSQAYSGLWSEGREERCPRKYHRRRYWRCSCVIYRCYV